jgi:hypothetical protein
MNDLSKTIEELRHYKEVKHESDKANKEILNEVDTLKDNIYTLNQNLIGTKSN